MDEQTPLRWAINLEPDFLVLQPPLLPVVDRGGPRDAMKALFAQRGFVPIAEADVLNLRPSNGCLFTRTTPTSAELLVTIGAQVGASRIPLLDLDADWLGRVIDDSHVGILVVSSAVRDDGTTTREGLLGDIDAGGVLAALVPSGDRA